MSNQLPAAILELAGRYERRLAEGDVVYEQGATPEHLLMVLSGRVVFEVVDAAGAKSVVHQALPGESLGVVSAFSGRPTSAAASAAEQSVLLAVPMAEIAEAFRAAPELAIAMIGDLTSDGGRRQRHEAGDIDDVVAPAEAAAPDDAPDDAEDEQQPRLEPVRHRKSTGRVDFPMDEHFQEEWFFVDDLECPVSGTKFEYLRVRAGAVRAASRDSDFRIVYTTIDPTYYSVVVCPRCSYAAYLDDFSDVSETERSNLLAQQSSRDEYGRPNLCGERTPEQAATAFTLAIGCYEARGSGFRRRAGLMHRAAWLERQRGNHEAELRLLELARDTYRDAYERDGDITDAAAMRAAYIIGDLTMRLGDPKEAIRWFLISSQTPDAKKQVGLSRMVYDRIQEAKEAVAAGADQRLSA